MSRSLPPHPTLEALKKQAKELLAAHKSADAAVCGTLRLLRRFAEATDAGILAADVSLSEAQFALAMDYGFESWAAMKRHVEAVAGEKVMSAVVYGVVTSAATGDPIDGAEVSYELVGPSYGPVDDGQVYTDADGQYEYLLQWRDVQGPELCYQCRHAAHACMAYWAAEPGPGPQRHLRPGDGQRHEINISLEEGYTLELAVENDLGQPVRGAKIVYFPEGVASLDVLYGSSDGARRLLTFPLTDAAGCCRIEGLHARLCPGSQCVAQICHPDYRSYILADVDALPREGHVARATVQLPKGICLSGQVICAETGRPIEGAELYANPQLAETGQSDPNEAQGNSATTDPDGRFEISGLLECPHDLIVRDDGWVHKRLKLVDVSSGEPLKIRLERGRVITGDVIDRNGKPAGKARIDAFGPGTRPENWENVTQADESGHFEIGGLSTDGPVCVVAAGEHRLCGVKEIGQDERHVIFDARDLAELEGMIVDERGQPVPNRVLCTVGKDWAGDRVSLGMLPVCDAGGVFRVRLPAHGRVRLSLRAHEHIGSSLFYNVEPITMQDGQPDRPLVFAANPPGTLTVKLLDADTRRPLPNVRTELLTSAFFLHGLTDDDGRCAFQNIPRYTSKLRTFTSGYENAGDLPIAPSDDEVEVPLKRTPQG